MICVCAEVSPAVACLPISAQLDACVELQTMSLRKLHEELKWEQEVTSRMQQALDSGEFIPWMQPKYSLKSELPCGSEALVRWNHPTLGILSPAKFIPIFERNGFVSKLDYCIWESVCRIIRHWMDEGNKPIPVSVNVSLVDLYNPNIVQILCELIRKYRIPASSLNLELTESAYMDNPTMTIPADDLIYRDKLTKTFNRSYLNRLLMIDLGTSINYTGMK